MVRIANETELIPLSLMLRAMYMELVPEEAAKGHRVYMRTMRNHFEDERDTIYVDDMYRGFFIVRDETEAIAPTLKRYNGIRVYIEPQHRQSRLLADFYKKLFEDFPDGDILGSTEINSKHIAVLEKRHTRIANVYKLNRSQL